MKVKKLPQKKQLTFFEVQYFKNDGKQGTAKHVLLVTYSTDPNRGKAKTEKSVQHRVKFDLTTDREINRKTKRHLGAEASDEIKQHIKHLKQSEDTTTMFGFRQVSYTSAHKYTPGKFFYKRQLDITNQVFAYVKSDNTFTAQFIWEGESIRVDIMQHKGPLSERQSVGVGYYTSASSDAELLDIMTEWQRSKSAGCTSTQIDDSESEADATIPKAHLQTAIEPNTEKSPTHSETETEPRANLDVPEQYQPRPARNGPQANDGENNWSCSREVGKSQKKARDGKTEQPAMTEQARYLSDVALFDKICLENLRADPRNKPRTDLGTSIRLPF